jgi:nicotinate-nucleotide adenylyltransferase
MKIGIFGGTFDPPHNGHINAINAAKSSLNLDLIMVVPTYMSPVKINKTTTAPEIRAKMCDLAFYAPGVRVSVYEINKYEINYTIETINHFQALYPEDEFFLLIGSDSFMQFHRWMAYKDILAQVTVVVIARQDGEDKALLEKQTELNEFGETIIMKAKPIEVSSTEIRNNLDECTDYLPKSVYDFIKLHKLYT